MRKTPRIIVYTIDVVMILLIALLLFNTEVSTDTLYVYNKNKQIKSNELVYVIVENEDDKVDDKKSEENNEKTSTLSKSEEVIDNSLKSDIISDISKEEVKTEEVITMPNVIETFVGTMTGYGPDCYGCTSNKTASGMYIGEGNIYANDPIYGSIRIVAADRKYPFGTIIRITNSNYYSEPIIAMVLDRGGSVGMDKRVQIDLLYKSESEATGLEMNITFEVLRIGY